MHNVNWDDLRFVLAVAEMGTVSAAARNLGVNHATVLRRIMAFEDRNGGPVFERSPQGYTLLPDRVRVIEAAREVENAVHTVDRLMQGGKAPLRGIVRVSSTDTLCSYVLPSLVAALAEQSTELRIDLMSSNSHLDFSRLQADVSVRPAVALADDLRGTIGAHIRFGTYCADVTAQTWLGLSGPLVRSGPAEWMAKNIEPEQIAASSDSFLILREMAAAGMGIAVLPRFVGDTDPRLIRCMTDLPVTDVPIWVASHADLADVPRLRAVRNRICEHLSGMAPALLGEGEFSA